MGLAHHAFVVDVRCQDLSKFDAPTSEGLPRSWPRVQSGLRAEELHAHVGRPRNVPLPREVAGNVYEVQRSPGNQVLEVAGLEQLKHPGTDLLISCVMHV